MSCGFDESGCEVGAIWWQRYSLGSFGWHWGEWGRVTNNEARWKRIRVLETDKLKLRAEPYTTETLWY